MHNVNYYLIVPIDRAAQRLYSQCYSNIWRNTTKSCTSTLTSWGAAPRPSCAATWSAFQVYYFSDRKHLEDLLTLKSKDFNFGHFQFHNFTSVLNGVNPNLATGVTRIGVSGAGGIKADKVSYCRKYQNFT